MVRSHALAWWGTLVLGLAVCAAARAGVGQRNVPEFPARGDDVRDVLLVLSQDMDFNLVVSPRVHGPVQASLYNVPLAAVLDAVLPGVDATWVDERGVVQVMTEREFERRYPERAPRAWPIRWVGTDAPAVADATPAGVVVRIRVVHVDRRDTVRKRPQPSLLDTTRIHDFSAQGDNIQDVLRILGEDLGVRIVVSPNVKGGVTADLRDVTLRQLLDTILPPLDAQYRVKDGTIQICTGPAYSVY